MIQHSRIYQVVGHPTVYHANYSGSGALLQFQS